MTLPRSSAAQVAAGTPISRAQLQPGDAIGLANAGGIQHIGLYLGNGQMIPGPRDRQERRHHRPVRSVLGHRDLIPGEVRMSTLSRLGWDAVTATVFAGCTAHPASTTPPAVTVPISAIPATRAVLATRELESRHVYVAHRHDQEQAARGLKNPQGATGLPGRMSRRPAGGLPPPSTLICLDPDMPRP